MIKLDIMIVDYFL